MAGKRKILLIDDDSVMHDLVRAFLTRVGYEFLSATSGEQGLEMARSEQPDLILLDYMMPDLDGVEVYRRLREEPGYEALREVPVIMLTAREEDGHLRSRMLEKGVFAYLSKPFGLHELRNVIENAFIASEINRRNRQLQDEIRRARDYLQRVIDAAPVGVFATDTEGKIVLANDFMARLFQVDSPQKLIGRNTLTVGLGGAPDPLAAVRMVLHEGEQYATEHLRFHSPDGRLLYLNVRVVPLREQDGQLRGAIGIVEDITEAEKRAVEMTMLTEIAQAMQGTIDIEEMLHLILTCATAGEALGFSRAMIFLLSEDGKELRGTMGVGPSSPQEAVAIWSSLSHEKMSLPEFLEKYGRRKPDPRSRFNNMVKELRHPLENSNCVLARAVREKRTFVVEHGRLKSGEPAECDWFTSVFGTDQFVCVPLVAGGRTIGLLVADNLYTGHPIDESLVQLLALMANQAGLAIERARAHADLAAQTRRLERTIEKLWEMQERLVEAEKLATVGQLAAQVAHEIRNPLVTIGGFARSMLDAPKSEEELKVIAGVIAEEAKRLENILNNVLDFTRLSKPNPEPSDLNDMVQKALFLVQDELEKNKIRLEKKLAYDLPEVYVDQQQMRQVLLNLLYNSIDSMKGGGTLRVETGRRDDEHVFVKIQDTGPGMDKEVLQNMFNPFFTTKSDGTGLGMPIAKQIVHSHGGRLIVDSKLGEGTTFTIVVPIKGEIVKTAEEKQALEGA